MLKFSFMGAKTCSGGQNFEEGQNMFVCGFFRLGSKIWEDQFLDRW